jgi:hypothetical protein
VQDYGERLYNPAIGKFLSVDPLLNEYPWYSPYQFAGNTPIQAIDLDGNEPWRVITSSIKVGKKLYKIYDKVGKITGNDLKRAGLDELMDVVDALNTIFLDPTATWWDRGEKIFEIVTGLEVKDGKKAVDLLKNLADKTGITNKQVMNVIEESLQSKVDDIHDATKNVRTKKEGVTALAAVEDEVGDVKLMATREGKSGRLDAAQQQRAKELGVKPVKKSSIVTPTKIKSNGVPSYHAEDGLIKSVEASNKSSKVFKEKAQKVRVVTSSHPKGVCKDCQQTAKKHGAVVAGRKQ